MFVLLTTANFPDVMLSAYYESRWVVFFFMVFEILGLFMFMNMLLAIFYESYKQRSSNILKYSEEDRNKYFNKLFEENCIEMDCHSTATNTTVRTTSVNPKARVCHLNKNGVKKIFLEIYALAHS